MPDYEKGLEKVLSNLDSYNGRLGHSENIENLIKELNTKYGKNLTLYDYMNIAIRANKEILKSTPEKSKPRIREFIANQKFIDSVLGVKTDNTLLEATALMLVGYDIQKAKLMPNIKLNENGKQEVTFSNSDLEMIRAHINKKDISSSTIVKESNANLKTIRMGYSSLLGFTERTQETLDNIGEYNKELADRKQLLTTLIKDNKGTEEEKNKNIQELQTIENAYTKIRARQRSNMNLTFISSDKIVQKEEIFAKCIEAKNAKLEFEEKYAGFTGFFKMLFNYSNYSNEKKHVNDLTIEAKLGVPKPELVDKYINTDGSYNSYDELERIGKTLELEVQQNLDVLREYRTAIKGYYIDDSTASIKGRDSIYNSGNQSVDQYLGRIYEYEKDKNALKDKDVPQNLKDILIKSINEKFSKIGSKILPESMKDMPPFMQQRVMATMNLKTYDVNQALKDIACDFNLCEKLGMDCYGIKYDIIVPKLKELDVVKLDINDRMDPTMEDLGYKSYFDKMIKEANFEDSQLTKDYFKGIDNLSEKLDKYGKYAIDKRTLDNTKKNINKCINFLYEKQKDIYDKYDEVVDKVRHNDILDSMVKEEIKSNSVKDNYEKDLLDKVQKRHETEEKIKLDNERKEQERIKEEKEYKENILYDDPLADYNPLNQGISEEDAKDIMKEQQNELNQKLNEEFNLNNNDNLSEKQSNKEKSLDLSKS